MIPPEDRWEPWPTHTTLTGGPERIYDNNPTTDTPRPVGFKPPTTLADRLHHALNWLGPDTNQAVTAVLKELENT